MTALGMMSAVTRVLMPPEKRPITFTYARVTSKVLLCTAASVYWYCV